MGKYRIDSARLKNWDYDRNAAYFVTICTKNRERFFGEIMGIEMIFNEIGEIAHRCWLEIPTHFPFVKLGNHIIMPDHTHGIIIIDKPMGPQLVGTQIPSGRPPSKNQFGPQSQNLASIIRGFKIGVTKNARLINPDFKWQPRFHDHIIRNTEEYQRISQYIKNNPMNWKGDEINNPL